MKGEQIFWLCISVVALGVSAVFFVFYHQAVDEGKQIRQNGNSEIQIALGWLVYFMGGAAGIIVKLLLQRLIQPAQPKNLVSLETLEAEKRLAVTTRTVAVGDQGNTEAANRLYVQIKVKVGAEQRIGILRKGVSDLGAILKEDADRILTLFPEDDKALRAYEIMEPYIMADDAFRRELTTSPSMVSISDSSPSPHQRQSLWFSRLP